MLSSIVIAAIITGFFSVITVLIEKSRKENKEDHNLVYESIKELRNDVKDVDQKIDHHINWHIEKK